MLLSVLKVREGEGIEVRSILASYESYFLCVTAINDGIDCELDRLINRLITGDISSKEFKDKASKIFEKIVDQIEESVCIENGDVDNLNPAEFVKNRLRNIIKKFRKAEIKGYLTRIENLQDYIEVRAEANSINNSTEIRWIFRIGNHEITIDKI